MNLEDTPDVNRRNDNAETEGQGGELLDEISALSQIISGARYPGSAWPVRRRWPARVILLSLAAAAAAIVIAVVLWPGGTAPRGAGPIQAPTGAVSMPARGTFVLSIPTDIYPTIAAHVVIDIPTVTMPSVGEAGGFKWDLPTIKWDLPTISFPSSPDWSNNHDS